MSMKNPTSITQSTTSATPVASSSKAMRKGMTRTEKMMKLPMRTSHAILDLHWGKMMHGVVSWLSFNWLEETFDSTKSFASPPCSQGCDEGASAAALPDSEALRSERSESLETPTAP